MLRPQKPPDGLDRSHRYFCYVCGTLLPHKISPEDSLVCTKCLTPTYLSWFVGLKVAFDSESATGCEIPSLQSSPYFQKLLVNAQKTLRSEEALRGAGNSLDVNTLDGPSVKRDCYYCGNNRMTYVTMQTRSADEGQTVIYTCTLCKKKEVENT
ncbi:DNA-directed RNA polymerase I subunit RPA12 [Echinococcus granulosus]|uniref:DNA-directed RNA polymerase subunit n=1 Tax=Echinococcus granulosus TaxID=6210 RepID=U6J5N1_ECHGR|nr:DNA-directed RNA polymerase I subunit RPA12 [Echinococcus granulosus]EUB62435.1 DNA-directed RNA polymerase I subunit RPA12 [Echinococcus granulosus]KAH9283154.1 DNA-directed RNA polymerase I subunit RPA12 [Echinococcus granulosus]CDS17017.1 DNA directed RNA polymerase I subunit RPA12 [Echinococcus granulosus]